MSRRKILTDDEVLAAVERVMGRVPPAQFTLGLTAAEAGLAPATLVQRFGDKRGLVLAAVTRSNQRFAEAMARRDGEPVDLVEVLAGWGEGLGDSISTQVQWLAEDVADPAFGALAAARFELMRSFIGRHLPPLRVPDEVAIRLIEAQWQGTVIVWSVERRGTLGDALRHALRDLLAGLAA